MAVDLDIIKILKILMNIFDDLDEHMQSIISIGVKYKDDLKTLQSVDIANPEMITVLQEKFSKQQMSALIQLFYQLLEFESKFKPILDERIKESNDVQGLVKGICSNLHMVLNNKK